jgi:ubiquinone/menaquinone biosynthesis C-methylase UbiE
MLKPIANSYDRIMQGMEDAGLTELRRQLLAPLSGRVLEIGAGTGRSVPLYPDTVTELTLAEPDRHMRARLEDAVGRQPRSITIDHSPGEHLGFPDDSFDAVVCSLVLCSVRDQGAVLREIRRVLTPGGQFVFIEHVAATDRPRRLFGQRALQPLWRLLAGNCHLTRYTDDAIAAAGFTITEMERASLRAAPPFIRPSIRGVAHAPL